MAVKQILPSSPFDGQEFIDAFRVKWVYNAEDDLWNRIGIVTDIPLARAEDDPLGPTNGLMSSKNKAMLDGLPEKAGGFGIILKPGYFLTEEHGADNVLTGDVKFISETLKFTCDNPIGAGEGCEAVSTVRFELSQDFLDSYSIEVRGPVGKKGKKGLKGAPGRPGTGDGPVGDPGEDGADAPTAHTFTGIKYVESDTIYDTAVVSLRLDSAAGVLEVTKARMDVPDSDKPATRVAATPITRDVEFLSEDLSRWQLIGAAQDEPTVDLNMVKLPKGWSGQSDSPVPVIPVKLSTVVQSIVDYYNEQATKVIRQWDEELRVWVIDRDKAARDVLHNLAVEVAECQFSLPLEFCLGIQPADCKPVGLGNAVVIVFIDEAENIYWPHGDAVYDQDVADLKVLANNPSSFSEFLGMAEVPGGRKIYQAPRDITPEGKDVPTPEFKVYNIGRPPTTEELINNYLDRVGNKRVDNIVILIDNSGSMTTAVVEPALGEFVSWLRTNTSATILEQEFKTERWIKESIDYLKQVLSQKQAT